MFLKEALRGPVRNRNEQDHGYRITVLGSEGLLIM